MEITEVLDKAQQVLGANHVFGEPVHQGEVVVIPVARLGGGLGGGGGEAPTGQGSGSGIGLGLRARPAGAFVVSQGRTRWIPAIDVNRIILGGQLVAATALLLISQLIRARSLALPKLPRVIRRRARRPLGRRWARALRHAA